jgi:valyl-tRNA synthetase
LSPSNWVNTYNQWMNNIHRLVHFSRQLWWGHQIPAWYGTKMVSSIVAETDEEAVNRPTAPGYTGELKRDEDVLDTWYSSVLGALQQP